MQSSFGVYEPDCLSTALEDEKLFSHTDAATVVAIVVVPSPRTPARVSSGARGGENHRKIAASDERATIEHATT